MEINVYIALCIGMAFVLLMVVELCDMAHKMDKISRREYEEYMRSRGMKEYVIVGDTEKHKGCLVYTCGTNKKQAEEVLYRMMINPTDEDERMKSIHENLRIEEVDREECWWR